MIRFKVVLCLVILLIFSIGCSRKSVSEEVRINMFAMNTFITLSAYGDNADNTLNAIENKIKHLESLWSTTNEKSEIYKLNNSNLNKIQVSPETLEIIEFTLEMAKKTNGALDPTIYPILTEWGFTTGNYNIPEQTELEKLLVNIGYEKVGVDGNTVTLADEIQIDLGGTAKGYTADIIANIVKKEGINSAIFDIGGNITTIGTRINGSKWRVGLKDPFGNGNFGVIEVADKSVVTSGGYERYFIGEDGKPYWHIINPESGRPAESGLISVTIVGDKGGVCDALSTALFVKGLDGAIDYWNENSDFEMILVEEDSDIYITNGLKNDFSLNNEYEELKVNVIERR